MTKVYAFKGWSVTDVEEVYDKCKATMEFISRNDLTAVDGSEEEVPPGELDEEGRYFPPEA